MSAPECGVCTRPVGDGLRLCTECGGTLITHLREIPGLLTELDTARSGQARFAGERVGGKSAEVPLPIVDVTRKAEQGVRLLGEREAHRVINAITTWARDIAETNSLEIPDGSIGGVVEWLVVRPHELRGHVAAEELHGDILGAVIGLRRVIDRPIERRLLGPCPTIGDYGTRCGVQLHVKLDDQGQPNTWTRCPVCREQHDVAAIIADTLRAAAEMLCTIDEACRLLDEVKESVPRGTIHSWVSRRRLVACAWQGDEPMYRLGDIRDLRLAGIRHRQHRVNGL